ncbi:unnamed protein product [Lupinus luteus]|uniref:Uncharacterized protein n=1 Tax=Lupinus luteus TaxID=3873 RepID=A0AAV1WAW2_LUPLU
METKSMQSSKNQQDENPYLFNRLFILVDIPPSLGNLSQLVVLDISNNHIQWTIPPEIGNLSKLIDLHLSNNFLEG